jgi:hypothetical protein
VNALGCIKVLDSKQSLDVLLRWNFLRGFCFDDETYVLQDNFPLYHLVPILARLKVSKNLNKTKSLFKRFWETGCIVIKMGISLLYGTFCDFLFPVFFFLFLGGILELEEDITSIRGYGIHREASQKMWGATSCGMINKASRKVKWFCWILMFINSDEKIKRLIRT